MAAEGTWHLHIEESGDRAIVAIQILRQAMDLSLVEAMTLKQKIPGTVISGTRIEIERLKILLAAKSLQVSVTHTVSESPSN